MKPKFKLWLTALHWHQCARSVLTTRDRAKRTLLPFSTLGVWPKLCNACSGKLTFWGVEGLTHLWRGQVRQLRTNDITAYTKL